MALIENKLNLDDVEGDVAAKYIELLERENDSDKVQNDILKSFGLDMIIIFKIDI